jgi:hypothetical protein
MVGGAVSAIGCSGNLNSSLLFKDLFIQVF